MIRVCHPILIFDRLKHILLKSATANFTIHDVRIQVGR